MQRPSPGLRPDLQTDQSQGLDMEAETMARSHDLCQPIRRQFLEPVASSNHHTASFRHWFVYKMFCVKV